MPTRQCSICEKHKDMKGGKICEKGHFFCYEDQKGRTRCPMDNTKLS
jgi:hypothetical protein